MAEIKNLEKVVAQLRARAAKANRDTKASVAVSFHTDYAIFVHENLEAFHPVGQAKFLEQPARENQARYAAIVTKALQQGKTMSQALLLAGLALQRDAQQLTPIDTGALRASATTTLET
jgi:hypothetical protein